MPDRLGPAYWRERAEETRAQAKQMRDASARRTLLEIADNYDQLAEKAETIRKSGLTTPSTGTSC